MKNISFEESIELFDSITEILANFVANTEINPTRVKKVSLYIPSKATSLQKKILLATISNILSNKAYFRKVFGCICSCASGIGSNRLLGIDISDLLKYGYERNPITNESNYGNLIDFANALDCFDRLEFVHYTNENKRYKFHLFYTIARCRSIKGNQLLEISGFLFNGLESIDLAKSILLQ